MKTILEEYGWLPSPTLNEILLGHLQKMDPHLWPGSDGLTLGIVLESYSRAADAGHVPRKCELLRRHPDLATELEVLFALLETAPKCFANPVISPLYMEHTD